MKIRSMVLLFLWLLPLAGFSQSRPDGIDSLVRESVKEHNFEGNVLVAADGQIIYHESFGFADAEEIYPVKNSTRFGIASITKMMTAIVILQLVEEQKLLLSDNLRTRLPSLNIPEADKITIHHLLLHISGLPNEPDNLYDKAGSPVDFVNRTLAGYENLQNFGQFNYANIDYVLLGLIIESITDDTWQEVITHRIIRKLNLTNTGFLSKSQYPDNFAKSFSYDESGKRISDPSIYIENYYAAGCMYSSAVDLLKIDQAMYGQNLLRDASKQLMFTSYPEYNYTGYSVWTYHYPFADAQPRIMERRGGIFGSNSVLVRMLDSKKTIIILSNNNRFNPDSFGDSTNLKEALIVAISKTKL